MNKQHVNIALTLTALLFVLLPGQLFGDNVRAVITGDNMEILDRGAVTTFRGTVKMVQGSNVLTSDYMKNEERKRMIHAAGNVVYESTGLANNNSVLIKSQTAEFNTATNYGKFYPGAEMLYSIRSTTITEIINVTAEVIELSSGSAYSECRGNVRMLRSSDTVTGDYMKTDNANNTLTVTGKVVYKTLTPGGTVVDIRSEILTYDGNVSIAKFGPGVELFYTVIRGTQTQNVKVTAEDVLLDNVTAKIVADKNVRAEWQTNVATGQRMVYTSADELMVVTGKPVIEWKDEKVDSRYAAEVVTLNFAQDKVMLDKNVNGTVVFK
ncbi:MAG: LptA/OstA family protein [Elusimicrobiota bacterium]